MLTVFVGGLRLLPRQTSAAIGAGFGRVVGLFQRGRSACWADLGRRAAEFACAGQWISHVVIEPAAMVCFEAAQAQGKGVLIATAHLGNWELMAAALAQRIDFAAIAAAPKPSPLIRWLDQTRAALGVRTLTVGQAREAARRLAEGGVVAVFIDQRTRERSRPVMFMGRPAPTPLTFERLAALSGSPTLLVWTARVDGVHRIFAEQIQGLDDAMLKLEAAVRRFPTQWIWLHDRWGRGPE